MIVIGIEVCVGVVVYVYLALFALGLASALNYENEKLCAIAWPVFLIVLSAYVTVRIGAWCGGKLSPAPLDDPESPTIPIEYHQGESYDQAILRPVDDRDYAHEQS